MKLFLNEDDWRIAYFQYPPSCDGYFSENFTALGFFAVKNEKKTEPNLIWANLTETNIFFTANCPLAKNPRMEFYNNKAGMCLVVQTSSL